MLCLYSINAFVDRSFVRRVFMALCITSICLPCHVFGCFKKLHNCSDYKTNKTNKTAAVFVCVSMPANHKQKTQKAGRCGKCKNCVKYGTKKKCLNPKREQQGSLVSAAAAFSLASAYAADLAAVVLCDFHLCVAPTTSVDTARRRSRGALRSWSSTWRTWTSWRRTRPPSTG